MLWKGRSPTRSPVPRPVAWLRRSDRQQDDRAEHAAEMAWPCQLTLTAIYADVICEEKQSFAELSREATDTVTQATAHEWSVQPNPRRLHHGAPLRHFLGDEARRLLGAAWQRLYPLGGQLAHGLGVRLRCPQCRIQPGGDGARQAA